MEIYLFIGSEPRFYARWEGQTFYANPGDERAFENPPTDGLWVLVPAPPKSARTKSEEAI